MAKFNYIENFLIENIKNGTYSTDQKIMSENELAEFFSVSRMTARKAILSLISKGYLYQIKGSGTYVSNYDYKISLNFSSNKSLSDTLKETGIDVNSKILHIKHKKANPVISKKLSIPSGTEIFEIARVRYVDNTPIALENIFIDKSLIFGSDIKLLENSIYSFFKNKGLVINKLKKEYLPVIPDKIIKTLFNFSNEASAIKSEIISCLDNGTPLFLSDVFYNTNKIKFTQN